MAAKASEGVEASFIEHLLELRTRILRSAVAILVLFVGLFPFRNTLYRLLARPLTAVLPKNGAMIATNLPATFIAPLKLALATAVALAVPYVLYQAWAFVAPGLYQRERRLITPLLLSSTLLFYLGMAFAYFLIFPLAFGFFARSAPTGVRVMTDINHYLSFVLTLFFAFGLAFEVPVAIVLLVLMGVLRPETLSGKRRYVILGAFILAAIITPPDAFSQTVLALAMWGLFEVGLFVAYRIRPQSSSVELTEPTPPPTPTPVIPPPREITPQSRPRRRPRRRRRTRKPPPPGGEP